jgi:ribosomal protein S18 acetylase RimI-like enzyme
VPAEPARRLVPFEPRRAARVASWAATPAEVRAWCARDEAPVPAAVVAAWAAAADVEAFLLLDAGADGGEEPVAYGELWVDEAEGEVELARLIVDPAHRGRGVGRALARALAARARDDHPALPLVALRVLPDNAAALRAYAAAGFVRVDPPTEAAWNAGQPVAWAWMRLA